MCGGPSEMGLTRPPALSLYCLHPADESTETTIDPEEEVWLGLKGTEPMLRQVRVFVILAQK